MILKGLLLLIPLFIHLTINLSVAPGSERYKLIGHRGGVVEDKYVENSSEALQEAINRKYWMIEVDIRETKDGIAIAQHDPDFKRFYNENKKVGEMTWEEIKNLRSTRDNKAPLSFEELVKMCQGKLQLMLDTKEPHSPKFCNQIELILKKYNMLSDCYVIGTDESRNFFTKKAKVGRSFVSLKKASDENENVSQHYFMFEHGNALDDEKLNWAKSNGVTIVPSVNKFHYKDRDRMMELAEKDIIRLKAWGVKEFQIDSEFDRWF